MCSQVLVFGFSMGVIEKGLLFLYLINTLGASTTLCGAVVSPAPRTCLAVSLSLSLSLCCTLCLSLSRAHTLSHTHTLLLFLYLINTLGASTTLCGAVVSLAPCIMNPEP